MIKIKDYELKNSKIGGIIRDYKEGNKIICRIEHCGDKREHTYIVKPNNAQFGIPADTFTEAVKIAERTVKHHEEFSSMITGMKGHRTRSTSKKPATRKPTRK